MTVRELWMAIHSKCLDCTCNQPKEVRWCPMTACELWPYRMGRHYPKQEPEGSDFSRNRALRRPKIKLNLEEEAMAHVA